MKISTLQKMIKKQFSEYKNLKIIPVQKMGHDNLTFHLGNEMLIRLPSAKEYASQVDKEQKWLPYFHEKLNIEIPIVLKKGNRSEDYPFNWSIYKWIEGETLTHENIDLNIFASDLADFLNSFHAIDCRLGPIASKDNFYRGGDLKVYDEETKKLIQIFCFTFDSSILNKIWEEALKTKWDQPFLWVHGDLVPTNIIVQNKKLKAIIDFGSLGVGDPACDLAMYYTFFDETSKIIFKEKLKIDENTWNRTKGWVLWKSLLLYKENNDLNSKKIIEELIKKDYKLK